MIREEHSHSTMYLLKPNGIDEEAVTVTEFTFHHVSIKTEMLQTLGKYGRNSHSTMYLLKPIWYLM